ncbi:Receptor-like protein kinase HERK 1, partial [Bienertia sinuspersici]
RYASEYLTTSVKILANTSATTNLQLHDSVIIFNGTASYRFPINYMGRYIIRLYFYPFAYHSYNLSLTKFSVYSQQFLLLKEYTPTSNTIKEYSFEAFSKDIEITLEPFSNFVAFLNALEIFSVPSVLIQDDATLINPREAYRVLRTVALETVFRVNMGGPTIGYNHDSLWRTWDSDNNFLKQNSFATVVQKTKVVQYKSGLATRNDAPIVVYGTCRRLNTQNDSNVTWNFDLDIDSWIASRMLDLTTLADGLLGVPIYLDFITPIIKHNKLDVSIGPTVGHVINPDAILNGLEIMKMSKSNILDNGPSLPSFHNRSKNHIGMIVRVIVVVVVFLLVFVAILFVYFRCGDELAQDHSTSSSTKTNSNTNATTTNMSLHIPLAAIQASTNNFDDSFAIGTGGFGKVYKGVLANGTIAAIKRGHARSQQGQTAFQTEIEMLSQFCHRNLVSLIGYCDENNENIQRLEICIGAAKGIQYLHNGSTTLVIHRDVKSSNILLDENFMAKVADFGLSKARTKLDQDHVTTIVKGSIGYIDPEYFRTQRITNKSDVYSFGVVLFEVLCARMVNDPTLPEEMINLVQWALKWQKKGQLVDIIDPSLQGNIKSESLKIYGDLAEKCVDDNYVERPSIDYVVWKLEFALQIQEDVVSDKFGEPSTTGVDHISELATTSAHWRTIADDDLPSGSLSKVFTDILKSEQP